MRASIQQNTVTKNRFVNTKSLTQLASSMTLIGSLMLTGCATTELLEDNGYTATVNKEKVKFSDQVIAFGKPATQLANMPSNSIVIVGEEYSYVMSKGSTQFVNLMTTLDRRYFNVEKDLTFTSPENDGRFVGSINLSYVKLKRDMTETDVRFFLQNAGKECSTKSDQRINAQRFCFDIDIQGGVYPRVSNYNMIKTNYNSLTQPYTVTFYTTEVQERYHPARHNSAQKLVLLPFALAFDVVTLPLQILEGQ